MRKIKLGDVLEFKRGQSLPGDKYVTSGEKIRLTLGNFNYPQNGFKLNCSKDNIYYSGEVRKEFLMQKGDIITPLTEQVRGLLGNVATIPCSNLYIQSQDVAKAIVINKELFPRFAYYLISSKSVKKQLDLGSQQTKIRHTSPDKLKDCFGYLPDIGTQKFICNIGDSIDNKIENNNKIISELESMSKTLYDYWFIQFDFPNEEGKPYKSSGGKMVYNNELKREIPDGRKLKHTVDICSIATGKEDANHSTEKGKYPFFTCSNNILNCDDFRFDSNSVLIAGNGDFNVKHYSGKFNAYQRTYVISPYDEIYIGLLHMNSILAIDGFKKGSNGSIVKFITLKDIQNIQMLLPNQKKILVPFNDILNKVDLLEKENQELSSLRDFLLPMLMNGQVTFK